MDTFATVADVESGWRNMSASERERAEVLLVRATAYLTKLLRDKGVGVDTADEVQMTCLLQVTCRLVQANIGTPTPDQGATWSEYTDDTVQEFTPTRNGVSFFLYDSEKRLLGLSGGRFCVAEM